MSKSHLIFLALILILGIYLRALPQGVLMEPDNYIYLSMANQALASNFTIPLTNNLSGFPQHNLFGESSGLIKLIIYPYALLSIFGVNLLTSMYLTVLLFAFVSILLAYFFTLRITKDQGTALLATLFMATMAAAVFKTSIIEWRGETFVPVIIGLGLFIWAEGLGQQSIGKQIALSMAGIFICFQSAFIWNGGIYAYAVIASLLLLTLARRIGISLKLAFPVILIVAIAGLLYNASAILGAINQNGVQITEIQTTNPLFIIADFSFAFILALVGLYLLLKEKIDTQAHTDAILSILIITMPLFMLQERWSILVALPIAILAGIGLKGLWDLKGILFPEQTIKIMIGSIIALTIILAVIQTMRTIPAESQTPSLFNALNYMALNTSPHSTYLTLWDDGSFIEGIATRTSYTDSVSGLNGTRVQAFDSFLLANATNLTYLGQIKPDYLFIRRYWLEAGYVPSFEKEIGLSNVPFNNTNYALLLKQQNISSKGIILIVVYKNANETIYKIQFAGQPLIPNKNMTPTQPTNTTASLSNTALFQFISTLNATVELQSSQITPITLSSNQIAQLPYGLYSYSINSPSQAFKTSFYGDAIQKSNDSFQIYGNAALYLNASAKT